MFVCASGLPPPDFPAGLLSGSILHPVYGGKVGVALDLCYLFFDLVFAGSVIVDSGVARFGVGDGIGEAGAYGRTTDGDLRVSIERG